MKTTIYIEDVNQTGNVIARDVSVCLVRAVRCPDRFPET